MNQLMLPSGVDKLSLGQKIVAGGIAGVALYFALPVLLALMVNLLMVVVIGVPLAFLAYNYQMVWQVFKLISWHTTKFIIGLDVIGFMLRNKN
jgi:phage shock protein PspC (stress-responsive transcriptional regulator)